MINQAGSPSIGVIALDTENFAASKSGMVSSRSVFKNSLRSVKNVHIIEEMNPTNITKLKKRLVVKIGPDIPSIPFP